MEVSYHIKNYAPKRRKLRQDNGFIGQIMVPENARMIKLNVYAYAFWLVYHKINEERIFFLSL